METNVVQGAFKPRRWWRTKWFVLGAIATTLVAAGIITLIVIVHQHNDRRAAQAEQTSLQTQLTMSVFSSHANAVTISTATRLINGVASKRYSMSKAQLAQIYVDRASAYSNMAEYNNALADFQTAINTDKSVQVGALQGELEVQSLLHHTSALVPILQQLVPLLRASQMPLASGQAAEYEAAIQAIQQGQEVSF